MIIRVGITADLGRRREERKTEFIKIYNWRVRNRGLTRDEAQAKKDEYVRRLGFKSHPDSKNDVGKSWNVYTFETAY